MSRVRPTHDYDHDEDVPEDVPEVADVTVKVVAPVIGRSRAHAPRAAEAAVADEVADAQRAVEARAQRQAQRGQQRQWAKRNATRPELQATTINDAFRDHERSLDHVASVAGAQRREALQAATTPRYREHQRNRWDVAISTHEPLQRASSNDFLEPEIGPEGPAQWVSLTPERDLRHETVEQTIERLTRFKSQRIKPQHAMAHFVASWEPEHEVTPGEAIVTGRRLLARVGINPLQQECAAYIHHDGATQHLHLVVARTRRDGGVWTAGLGVDRALALESRLMAHEHGEEWDQRMVARSGRSKGALRLLEEGMLGGYIVHVDGSRERIDYQGPEVAARMEGDVLTMARHGGAHLAKMVGQRGARVLVSYCAR